MLGYFVFLCIFAVFFWVWYDVDFHMGTGIMLALIMLLPAILGYIDGGKKNF